MSIITDYSVVSNNYDKSRIPVGADIFLKIIREHFNAEEPKLDQIQILDVGCGTGNYSLEFCKAGIGELYMFDANEDMMSQAQTKLATFIQSGTVKELKQNFLPSIPYEDETMDVVMINQVLHHLDKDGHVDNFPKVFETLQETMRVLKPGGLLLMSYSTPEQLSSSYWYLKLIPAIVPRFIQRSTWCEQLTHFLPSIGYRADTLKLESVAYPSFSLTVDDPEGPLKKEWRDQDSFFSSATPQEIDEMISFLKIKKKEGTLRNLYIELNGKGKGKEVGHTTFLSISK